MSHLEPPVRAHHRFWPRRLPHALRPPQTSLWENLSVSARRYPDKAALVFFDRVTTYAALHGQAGGFPSEHAAVEDADVAQSCDAQGLLGLGGTLPGAAHQHDVLVEVGEKLVAVFPQQIEGDVVGAGNVHGLEFARCPDVDDAHVLAGVGQLAQGDRIDGGGEVGHAGLSWGEVGDTPGGT